MESAHYAHVVLELNGLNVLMMVESSFMLLCNPLDFASQNIHLHKVKEDEVNRTYFQRRETRLGKDSLGDLVLGGMIILKRVLD